MPAELFTMASNEGLMESAESLLTAMDTGTRCFSVTYTVI
jgi:hypothetical protein